MRMRNTTWMSLGIALSIASGTGCFGSGIRKLNEVEMNYFVGLQEQTQASEERMTSLLEEQTAFNEEQAIRESARFRNDIRRAKIVYSVREVLTAPRNDRASFIQVTRNKVILYHLAEAAKAEDEAMAANMALGRAERRQLIGSLKELSNLVAAAVASNKLLHNHLNKSGDARLADFISEVGRQVSTFNEKIQEGDQKNPVIQRLVATGEAAQKRADQADKGLAQFIGVWSKLNQEGM